MLGTRKLNYLFLFSVIALSAAGLAMIFSASPTLAMRLGDPFYFIKRDLFYLAIGFCAMYYGFRLDLEKLKQIAWPLLLLATALLIIVFVPGVGRKISGASRWIDLGVLSFQPSELIKLALVVFLARWFDEKQKVMGNFVKASLPPLIIFGFIALLIMKQPDLGTVLVLGATLFSMLFLAGSDLKQLLGLLTIGLLGTIGASLTSAYRFRRIIAYLDPWQDPQGVGFHIIQSLLAIGSGGLFGAGLGASKQKFFYLPQQFTDFIFAILCEETGFLGAALVIVLFAVLAVQGFRIVGSTNDRFKSLLAAGLVSWISWQAIINICVVVGLVPTTGIPLPFFSYGGTATIINLFAVGVILNVSKK